MTRAGRALAVVLVAWSATACEPAETHWPAVVEVDVRDVLLERDGVRVVNGGYGSAIAVDPHDRRRFFLLTDRGPNVDGRDAESKRLPAPGFTPHIGRFRLEGERLVLESTIELKDASGRPLTGVPRASGGGREGEAAFGPDGAPLAADANGVDTEGMVALADGSFWVSDEYGPDLLHVDATGRTLERVDPLDGGPYRLPRVLARRRPNRGMEGLAVTPDGTRLVGLMQSALNNPTAKAGKDSRVTRLVAFEVATGRTQQFVYLREASHHSCSEIAAITATTFLVLERDGRTPGDPAKPSQHIRVWRIDLAGATDVSDPGDSESGMQVDGKTLEECTPEALAAAGIRAVAKSEVLDLLARGYPHDKPEGLAVIDERTIAVSNDDDFGVIASRDAPSGFTTKWLPGVPRVADHGTVRFYALEKPLR